jgi:hypothetical protein
MLPDSCMPPCFWQLSFLTTFQRRCIQLDSQRLSWQQQRKGKGFRCLWRSSTPRRCSARSISTLRQAWRGSTFHPHDVQLWRRRRFQGHRRSPERPAGLLTVQSRLSGQGERRMVRRGEFVGYDLDASHNHIGRILETASTLILILLCLQKRPKTGTRSIRKRRRHCCSTAATSMFLKERDAEHGQQACPHTEANVFTSEAFSAGCVLRHCSRAGLENRGGVRNGPSRRCRES